jgi:hypothetical protein
MKLIAKYFFILLTLILFNCKGENDTQINLNGYYGMSKYFQSKNTNADYIGTFLLKIENKKIIIFGTVNTWGSQYKYMINKSKDTILLENNFKIYRKSNNDNVIYFERCIDNKIEKTEYQKIPNIEKVIDEKGINSIRLSDFLNKTLIVGKYKFKDKIIIFKENGKVVNLENFNNFRIRPRLGTNTYYDDRIIETEKGIWKYQKKNGNLILTKYSNKRDEYEMFILSDEKIELEKITSP